jgi:hypothetical protein
MDIHGQSGLDNNQFIGTIPDSIGNLEKLQVL